MMRAPEQRRVAIASGSAALLEYRAMPETMILLDLLDALADEYYAELATIKVDQLAFKQGALAQVNALCDMLRTNSVHRSVRV
ncbi:hypothetical protein CR152_32125 (plasmid) [Massilia violaceinigra]|uniref:Uncharacterized protein n=1 Tax=Massilia violaceinigra TaxID=2045208 RepID=A0A2D2DW74_9BURK|nr:hypothetical protein [Massilia violaceinigra]ATQ79224.1 hypothetical protein CR152_32125 [Massilia violaceinigra]